MCVRSYSNQLFCHIQIVEMLDFQGGGFIKEAITDVIIISLCKKIISSSVFSLYFWGHYDAFNRIKHSKLFWLIIYTLSIIR